MVSDITTHRPIVTYEAMREPKGAPHKLHIHLFESPVEILGTNGHVTTQDGTIIPGLYTTGWIKRGPVGLIGNTKSDAKETTEMLINDWETGQLTPADNRDPNAIFDVLKQRGIPVTTWDGWHALDAAERELGQAEGRERKKIVEWNDMLHHAVLAPVSF
ncbi:hypothetical protein FRC0036_02140 [Corynebacterium diphtheriae]|uniref:Uncharacterized protein n=1 Tax=Corynebacterium diphtheriae TaxID=1717 RepID=A0A811G6R6_CORDP|nr:hypothetical protein [Corynebacterium diphtheriae bv. mitis]OSQ04646.1 hypothetical protein B1A59_11620 [Corynebacterium diphtheriae]MBG9302109.1 hypothetical protein [Corynebacterium diphtheriae bv. mitis]OWM42789.1 hypothetical protein BU164_11530 [Corynebacterium diphtheriae]OWM46250.1 hypothetical protein BU163_11460 [Corynebacterium diphtheriae]